MILVVNRGHSAFSSASYSDPTKTPSLPRRIHLLLRVLIGLVWFVNGLVCKVLGLVPRHEQIVARVLGESHAHEVTVAVGFGEIALALWVWSGLRSRINAILQMVLVAAMNALESILAPDLLLWGRLNVAFAALFIALVYYHEFVLKRTLDRPT